MGQQRKGLAISGGGAYGAYAGGILQHLIGDLGKDYDVVVGTSTGALMAPLAAMNKIDLIKKAYTNISNEDIYNVNPFKVDGGEVTGIKFWNAVWRILRGEESLGVTKKLRGVIAHFVPEQLYDDLQETDKQVIVAVTNLNKQRAEYKPNYINSRQGFIDWMWASASVPVYMSLVKKDGYDYADGGLVDHNPIQLLFERSCKSMDVIMLRPEIKVPEFAKNTNVLDVVTHTIGTMAHEISNDDIQIAELMSLKYNVDIDFYYLPEKLSDNSLVFNESEMEQWWQLGYQRAQKGKEGHQRFYASEKE